MQKKSLALTGSLALVLTACGAEGDGLGDSGSLSDVGVQHSEEGAPEIVLERELDVDGLSSRLINQGDGEQISADNLVEYEVSTVDPSDGTVMEDSYEHPAPQLLPLYDLIDSDMEADQFIAEAITEEGVTIGSDLAVYIPADDDLNLPEPLLWVMEPTDQFPPYADGEEQEQSGDLPEIDSEIGQAPELVDHDTDQDPPEELNSEALITGDGEEIGEDDHLFVQYRGWRWSDGEEFDGTWSEDEEVGQPTDFSLQETVPGWSEALTDHQEGDRVLMALPPEQAYGDQEGHDLEDETLIFVVDVLKTLSAEEVADMQQPAPEEMEQQAPDEMDEEELQEMLDQMEMEEGAE